MPLCYDCVCTHAGFTVLLQDTGGRTAYTYAKMSGKQAILDLFPTEVASVSQFDLSLAVSYSYVLVSRAAPARPPPPLLHLRRYIGSVLVSHSLMHAPLKAPTNPFAQPTTSRAVEVRSLTSCCWSHSRLLTQAFVVVWFAFFIFAVCLQAPDEFHDLRSDVRQLFLVSPAMA